MKPTIQLQIPEPCQENWEKMSPSEQGRFCSACCKQVVDFSNMTDPEILRYMSTATDALCGRAATNQLNRNLVLPAEPRAWWLRYWMGIAASMLMMTGKASAQVKLKPGVVTMPLMRSDTNEVLTVGLMLPVKHREERAYMVTGKVVDEESNPVPYASVLIKGSHEGALADSTGNFILTTKTNLRKMTIVISSVGFESKAVPLQQANINSLPAGSNTTVVGIDAVRLSRQSMGEVVVTCSPRSTFRMGGAASGVRVYTIGDKLKDLVGMNEIKIYPNPVLSKRPFLIRFSVKELGEYVVQFVDAAGRIVTGRQMNISEKNYTEHFDGDVLSASGVYFVNLTNRRTGKMYSARLLKQ